MRYWLEFFSGTCARISGMLATGGSGPYMTPLSVFACGRTALGICIVLTFFAQPTTAAEIKMTVQEPSGVQRSRWPVTSGVPLARGALKDAGTVRLVSADGRELPLQSEALARWPDGSVKWLLLDFQVDLAAGEKKSFRLQSAPGAKPAAPRTPVRVAAEDKGAVIETGPMRLRLSAERFRLLDAVWLDVNGDGRFSEEERVTGSEGAGIVLTTPDGSSFRADGSKAKLSIEQAGPLRGCVLVEGKHASAGRDMFRYVVRIHAFAGRPMLRIHYTFINDYQGELMAKIDSLEMVFSLPEKAAAGCLLDGKRLPAGRLFQVDEQHYQIDGKPAGKRAPGWAALGGKRAGLAVGLREFWQNWPKSIEQSPGRLALGICPQFDKGLYDGKPLEEECKLYYNLRDGVHTLKVGVARTHELWATFFAGPPEPGKLSPFFQAAEEPLLATCEPAYVCSTEAAGRIPPADPQKYFGYDAWLSRALDTHLKRREKAREYGMLNYGDWYGERRVNWGNLEYDLAHGLFLQYLRTGDRRFFRRAEQAARHHIDVDVIHATGPHSKRCTVGEIWAHSVGHTGGYYLDAPLPVSNTYQRGWNQNVGHVWVAGDLDYYHLTGDRRARDVAAQIADTMASQCPTRYGDHIRALGWPMILVLAAYEATGEQKYLDAATKNWEVLKKHIDWQRGWVVRLAKGHCLHPDRRCEGNVPFMEGLTCCALARYHRITGQPEVLRAISVGIDQMIRECWQEDVKTFRYTACPLSSKTPYSLLLLSAEALAYEAALTGNKEHLRIFREGFRALMAHSGGLDFGKGLAQVVYFAPYGLTALED